MTTTLTHLHPLSSLFTPKKPPSTITQKTHINRNRSGVRVIRVCSRIKDLEPEVTGSRKSASVSVRKEDEEKKKQNYYVNTGNAIRTLREEFPDLFYRELTFDIYRDDIVFKDPLNTFFGIENYKSIYGALRFNGRIFFKALWVDIISVWQPVESTIMIRWTVHGIPRVPWESRGRFDATSEYKLDKNAVLVENFRDLKMRYVKPLSLYQEVLKLNGTKQGRFLGLSVGADSIWDECVGVAVSNSSNKLAKHYGVYEMTESNIRGMVSDFQDLIAKHSVSGIIVGLPHDRRDVPNVKHFVNSLSKTGKLESVPYTYWDEEDLYSERIRSMENPFYFNTIAAKKLSDKKIAASGMLQDYLESYEEVFTPAKPIHEHSPKAY
ncbi:hypothetical protein CTI12_AA046180 [Artemisia annua]|uniref:YqgF/RNase H-like domain-containing protein n=1 Tax=Artemisia annua TaxID=35608 RepID=A0A2U1QCC5_ARTAN|nr:hypothetical protein CTI12_AA046180 [Artemisia annua]